MEVPIDLVDQLRRGDVLVCVGYLASVSVICRSTRPVYLQERVTDLLSVGHQLDFSFEALDVMGCWCGLQPGTRLQKNMCPNPRPAEGLAVLYSRSAPTPKLRPGYWF